MLRPPFYPQGGAPPHPFFLTLFFEDFFFGVLRAPFPLSRPGPALPGRVIATKFSPTELSLNFPLPVVSKYPAFFALVSVMFQRATWGRPARRAASFIISASIVSFLLLGFASN